jgi:hypothetical protein
MSADPLAMGSCSGTNGLGVDSGEDFEALFMNFPDESLGCVGRLRMRWVTEGDRGFTEVEGYEGGVHLKLPASLGQPSVRARKCVGVRKAKRWTRGGGRRRSDVLPTALDTEKGARACEG